MYKHGFPREWSTLKKLIWLQGSPMMGENLPWSEFSGNPLSVFVPKIHDLREATVEFAPKQDLHGYDNPWPAGGGKNLFNPDAVENGYIDDADGVLKSTTSTNTQSTDYIPVVGDTVYGFTTGETAGNWGAWYDENKTFISGIALGGTTSGTITSPSTGMYLRFTVNYQGRNPNYATNVQIEKGSVTPWSPYSNICPISGWTGVEIYRSGEDTSDYTTYSVTWQDEAGTVYGGTLTIQEDGSVTLTIDREKKTITSWNGAWGATENGYAVYSNQTLKSINWSIAMSNLFKKSYNGYGTMPVYSFLGGSGAYGTWSFILPNTVTSLAEANAWLSNLETPLEIVSALATPVTYHLDPQTITALKGINTMWTDGDSLTVEARGEAVNNA